MTGSPIPPPGIYGKGPFPLVSSSTPLSLSKLQLMQEATPTRANPYVELFKVMVERTEHANVRISKLNLLWKQRRLESQSPVDVLDNEPGESLPHISLSMELILFMMAIFGRACSSSLRSQALELSAWFVISLSWTSLVIWQTAGLTRTISWLVGSQQHRWLTLWVFIWFLTLISPPSTCWIVCFGCTGCRKVACYWSADK